MARKSGETPVPHNGWHDVLGIVLIGLFVGLFAAQLSFDPNDVSFLTTRVNNPPRNFIGVIGAPVAYDSFYVLGGAAYVLPWLIGLFGLSYLSNVLAYVRLRFWRSLLWCIILLVAISGLLFLADDGGLHGRFHVAKHVISAGGFLGYLSYGQTYNWDFGTCLLGKLGASMVYVVLGLISLLFLTNFRLGEWIRSLWAAQSEAEEDEAKSDEERVLEKRARELDKQKRQLEEEVSRGAKPEKTPSGLGADLQPVPEPTVRDLSVPQAKGPRLRKTTYPDAAKEPAPAESAEAQAGKESHVATTDEVLGRKSEAPASESKPTEEVDQAEDAGKEGAAKPEEPKSGPPKVEPMITIADGSVPPPRPKPAPRRPKPMTVASVPMIGDYHRPPLDFLQMPDLTVKPTESKEELMANARLMQQTLAQFDIDVSLGDITKGPTITRYELHPAPGVKLEKISGLANNIAAALKAERINILAPVPGKSSVGVEVPNAVKTKVIMRDLFESDEWRNTKAKVPIALGKDVYGHPIIADLAEMPHLLIAGSTGSGKSVCINSIIASLLYRFSPDQLRFVMIDPKVVELQQYNALPHLVVPVVTDPKKVILALRWVVNEMEKRYKIFARVGVRNIKSFNERPKNKPLPEQEMELPLAAKKEKVEPGAEGFAVEVDEEIIVPREEDIVIPEKLSYIVVIIDELADLMLVAPADVEMAIARITQMARAAGIHCIVATQRPSVDVITGVIKANIPARIAFQVASRVDSRTILDAMGADKLLGKGDMLYLPPGSAKLIRAQGALITDQEINSIVDFIAKQGKPSYEMEIHQQLSKATTSDIESGIDEDEELIQQCIEVIRSEQKASVSLMQRRLRLGYTRAARIMDELEGRGIVGPSKGAEPRDILIDLDGEGHDGGGQSAV
jgi:S-DNA-T family DNA segregation ATPase FtsK/SpoIIIE